MRTVYLLRHAKSSWDDPDWEDFERPLNKRGRKSALLMGTVLQNLKAAPDLILSSPANRAAMTARIIAAGIHYPVAKIDYCEAVYLADENTLIRVMQNMDDTVRQAMLVGHNPGLTELAGSIGGRRIANIPTGGVCCVDLKITSWKEVAQGKGRLRFFEFPKKHPSG